MSLLSGAQLSGMRNLLGQMLPDQCVIQRRTIGSDGGGGSTESWSDHLTVPCRIAPIGGGEDGQAASRISEETTHLVTLAAHTDVVEADRILIGDQTFDVTLVRKRGAWELSRRVEVKELL